VKLQLLVFFQAPSTTQGFQYLYLPTKARIPLGKLRTTFKKLGVNNGRLLDLHYPDRNIVAVLVHNDYAPELTELLTKKGVKLNTTFDPCAASVLKDPKYATDTLEQRQQIAQLLHNQRVQKSPGSYPRPRQICGGSFLCSQVMDYKDTT
jgi:hypothetical protein